MTLYHTYRHGESSPSASFLPTTQSILAPTPEFTGLISFVEGGDEADFTDFGIQGTCWATLLRSVNSTDGSLSLPNSVKVFQYFEHALLVS